MLDELSLTGILSRSSEGIVGKVRAEEVVGGDRYVERSFGRGGTGGTFPSSLPSPLTAMDATRSLTCAASADCALTSLLALFLRPLLDECLPPDTPDIDVALVAADIDAESRELGVLAYVVDDVEPLLGVKLSLAGMAVFLGVLSRDKETSSCVVFTARSATSGSSALSPRPISALSLTEELSFRPPLPRFDLPESEALRPSHCDPDLPEGVAGLLELDGRPKLPTLARARAPFPEIPSSLRSASAAASSSSADQPSWVPRKREWATLGEECIRRLSLEERCNDAIWVDGVFGALFRNWWMEVDDGDGGRCEKSVV